jgi:hypothetical protein
MRRGNGLRLESRPGAVRACRRALQLSACLTSAFGQKPCTNNALHWVAHLMLCRVMLIRVRGRRPASAAETPLLRANLIGEKAMNSRVPGQFRRVLYFAFVAVMLGAASLAHATVINFEDLTDGAVVTNQYAADGITFSSEGGEQILVTTQPQYLSTPPNFICTGTSSIDCVGSVIFTFATPVNDLQFDAVGNQNAVGTPFAVADIYQNGVLTVSNLDLLVSLGNESPDHQDFSAYGNITKVVIHGNTDPAGTGYDTISFVAGVVSIPEPGTLSLFGLGILALAGLSRLRKAA